MVTIDMEMSSCCAYCYFCVEDKYADMTCVLLDSEWQETDYNENHRDEKCPLVEIEEPKAGKWIIDDKEQGRIWHCHCSNCKKDLQDYIGGSENWWLVRLPDYCPNCGAKMEGDENE